MSTSLNKTRAPRTSSGKRVLENTDEWGAERLSICYSNICNIETVGIIKKETATKIILLIVDRINIHCLRCVFNYKI